MLSTMNETAGEHVNSLLTREPFYDELIDLLAEDAPDQQTAGEIAERMLSRHGDSVFTDLIWNLSSLRYEPLEAKQLFLEIMSHKQFVSDRLGRNVGIRVAALDYFLNIIGRLARPRIADPEIIEQLYRDATTDPLTGLANRRHYRERLANEITRSKRYQKPFVIALFDVDNFKKINDTQGHGVGDGVLQKIARIIREAIRTSDLGARWGGEEFVVLMPETPKRGAVAVAERIRERVAEQVNVTLSGGLAAFPGDGTDERDLFIFADRALYRAKSEGKNQICPSPRERRAFPRLNENVRMRITLISDTYANLEAQTENIGGGGIAFWYTEPLPIAGRILGELQITGRKLQFVGRIVRVEEIKMDRFEVGVQFLSVDPEVRNLLLSCSN